MSEPFNPIQIQAEHLRAIGFRHKLDVAIKVYSGVKTSEAVDDPEAWEVLVETNSRWLNDILHALNPDHSRLIRTLEWAFFQDYSPKDAVGAFQDIIRYYGL